MISQQDLVRLSRAFRACALISVCLIRTPGDATEVGDFYRGKTITFLLGSDPGGAFDAYAHLLAKHMPKYIEQNPRIITRFVGGQSGGLQIAEQMSNTVQRDGLTMAMTTQSIVVNQVLRPNLAKYDASKWFWLGNMAPQRSVLAVWHTTMVGSVTDARNREILIGATGQTSPTYMIPDMANRFLGTRFKIINGYKNVNDLNFAMQRGEIEGRTSSWVSIQVALADDFNDGKVTPLFIAALTRQREIPTVPTLIELLTDQKQRSIAEFASADSDFGRSVFLPPGVPPERANALRAAFERSLKDSELIADAKLTGTPIELMGGEMLMNLTQRVLAAPADVIEYNRN